MRFCVDVIEDLRRQRRIGDFRIIVYDQSARIYIQYKIWEAFVESVEEAKSSVAARPAQGLGGGEEG